MRRTRWLRQFFFLALALGVSLLAACSSDQNVVAAEDETPDDSEVIDDGGEPLPLEVDALRARTWTLRFGGGPDGEVVLVDGWPITITFEDETFGGTAACNEYGGTYNIDASQLTLRDIGQNDAGCEPDVQASEAAFLSALLDVQRVDLLGNEMALSGPATELIFAPVESAPIDNLVDQLWVLEGLIAEGVETSPQNGPVTLQINSDGGFIGSTGCRTLSGRYLITGNSVLFNEMAAEGECPTSLFDQDSLVITVLGDGFTATIEDDMAILVSAGNEALRYRATTQADIEASPSRAVTDAEFLEGIEWVFVGGDSPEGIIADPRTIDEAGSITLTFSDGEYNGTVVCNGYGGTADLTLGLQLFTLGIAEGEQEGCGDGLDEIAEAYLNALPQMSEGGIEDGGQALVMNDGDATEFLFERAQ